MSLATNIGPGKMTDKFVLQVNSTSKILVVSGVAADFYQKEKEDLVRFFEKVIMWDVPQDQQDKDTLLMREMIIEATAEQMADSAFQGITQDIAAQYNAAPLALDNVGVMVVFTGGDIFIQQNSIGNFQPDYTIDQLLENNNGLRLYQGKVRPINYVVFSTLSDYYQVIDFEQLMSGDYTIETLQTPEAVQFVNTFRSTLDLETSSHPFYQLFDVKGPLTGFPAIPKTDPTSLKATEAEVELLSLGQHFLQMYNSTKLNTVAGLVPAMTALLGFKEEDMGKVAALVSMVEDIVINQTEERMAQSRTPLQALLQSFGQAFGPDDSPSGGPRVVALGLGGDNDDDVD